MTMLKTAMIQQKSYDDSGANLFRSEGMIREAAVSGASLVIMQELHTTRYFCQSEEAKLFDLAETIPGRSTEFFSGLASELGIVLVTSLFERRAPGICHNTAVVFERDGSVAGKYRKMHIPDDPGFYEKFYFTPGDTGFNPIRTSAGVLGVLVCWDQWYPEAARLMALAGAEILIYPTAIGWDPSDSAEEQKRQLEAWVTVQRGHAVANGIPLVAVNRVGLEGSHEKDKEGIIFWGNSFAAGPQGEILARGAEDAEEIVTVDLDMGRSEEVRRIWPFLRDRRIDAYGDILKRYRD